MPAGVILAGAELTLRALDFRYQRAPGYLRFAYPDPAELHQVFKPDLALFWRMRPGYDFGPGYGRLNDRGFREEDFFRGNKRNPFRIACLGDSVTFGLPDGDYVQLLLAELKRRRPEKEFEVMNFGVPGYSSLQGLRLLNLEVLGAPPQVITVLFGWNDHWLAQGFSDQEQRPRNLSWVQLRDLFLARLRIYQALNFIFSRLFPPGNGELKLRVPEEQYRENLRTIARRGRANGALVVLCTSPAGLGLEAIPEYLTELGFIRANADLEPLHRRYNEIVREVGREENVPVVDLEAIFQEEGLGNFFDHPEKDIIHPNLNGMHLIARSLATVITQELFGSSPRNRGPNRINPGGGGFLVPTPP